MSRQVLAFVLVLGSLLVLVTQPTTAFTVKLLGSENTFGERHVGALDEANGNKTIMENVDFHTFNEISLPMLSVGRAMTNDEIDAYLIKCGYLTPLADSVSEEERKEALKKFQGFVNLDETGVMDKNTMKQMRRPQCGLPDPVSNSPVEGKSIIFTRPTPNPTTKNVTSKALSTKVPTTKAPTTMVPTTKTPATKAPTTEASTTENAQTNYPNSTTLQPVPKRRFPCPFRFWATTTDGNRTYGFLRRNVYEIFRNGRILRKGYIRQIFPRGPLIVGAAAHNEKSGHIFLFRGRYVFRFTDHKLDRGFPKELKNFIRAAVVVDEQLIAFSFTHVHYLDEDTMEDYVDGEVTIKYEYPGLPYGIRAAVSYGDGKAYILYLKKAIKLDMYTGEITETEENCGRDRGNV